MEQAAPGEARPGAGGWEGASHSHREGGRGNEGVGGGLIDPLALAADACDLPYQPGPGNRPGAPTNVAPYEIFVSTEYRGRYIAVTIVPMITPRKVIMIGSSSFISPATAVSTSSS